MRYLLLIYSQEVPPEQVSPEVWAQVMEDYNKYTADLDKSGVSKVGEALQDTKTATSVRVRDGKKVITDGPFAETKEALGGYYVLNVKNLDEAIEWAAKCPGAKTGTIELRPIMEFS